MTDEMLSASGHPPRVLACDDEPQVLRALTVIFRSEGCQVVTAATADEALAAVAVTPVEAAVIDVVLPGRDGIELCRLRASSPMPIVVLSAVDEEEQKIRALAAGADDYVTKPFSPRELMARLVLNAVWGPLCADTRVLRTHVARLRRKIEPAAGPGRRYIHTESGVGFRFDPR